MTTKRLKTYPKHSHNDGRPWVEVLRGDLERAVASGDAQRVERIRRELGKLGVNGPPSRGL
jgi:hypothetical protein